ncbi:MAG: DUF167 domain-containing protein [Myxococcales bacterium]|nr:DUF167 domain-containing protein [Myxococcales bacterium]
MRVDERDGAVTFEVRVTPRASREAVRGLRGEALDVALTSPPVEGAANLALRKLLARELGVAAGAVSLIRGERGRVKLVRVEGVTADSVRALVSQAGGGVPTA